LCEDARKRGERENGRVDAVAAVLSHVEKEATPPHPIVLARTNERNRMVIRPVHADAFSLATEFKG
jgi:hypothetical protein